jgi:uncharacterized membrane protein (DUF4010 family)
MSVTLISLFLVSLVLSLFLYWQSTGKAKPPKLILAQKNPLELTAAFIFAALFVLVSLASAWAKNNFGDAGLYTLAVVVGVSDISPFVVSLAQNSIHGLNPKVVSGAILIATSSNNLLKAIYAIIFAGFRFSLIPVIALVTLAVVGCIQPFLDLWQQFG